MFLLNIQAQNNTPPQMFLRFFKPDPILALILSIPIALPFSNLNRLNVLSTCYKVVPIDIAQSLEFRLC